MSDGFQVDPDELTWYANRLSEAADDLDRVVSTVDGSVGDLGPQGITEVVEGLVTGWVARLRAVDLAGVAESVREAGEAYRQADRWERG
ncbi:MULTISPECIES: WXG100 family type VII secretion target [unclassified Saccharothrix]|uniref:WXG100 family type VII secretion target n=1 Tax=unclassified Saccharothrix TaxID=2593673 RepID=UPI00307DDC0C